MLLAGHPLGSGGRWYHGAKYAERDSTFDRGFRLESREVEAGHGGMVPLVLPAVFEFFDRQRKK